MDKALNEIKKESPFYTYLLLGIQFQENYSIRNLAIKFARTGDIVLLYNPSSVKKKPLWFLKALILHEIMHIINQHFRIKPKNAKEKKIWDLAMDAAINQYIPELDARSVPLNVLIEEGHGTDNDTIFVGPPAFMINATAEEYFEWIMNEFEKRKDFDVEALPDTFDDHSSLYNNPETTLEMILEITQNKIGKAFNMFGKELDSGLKQMISLSLQNSKVDWKTALRKFSGASKKGERYMTPLRPNRRYENLPGWKQEYKSKIAVIMDTSASIIDEELNQFITEIEKLSKYDVDIVLIQIDKSVTLVTKYISGKWKNLEVYGGGETNLQPAIDYAEKELNIEGLIIFTDGFVDIPHIKRRALFVLSSKYNHEFLEDAIKIYGKSSVIVLKN
ncbi:hypothetical protein JYK00_04740 [Thermosipho ferrireducens]|uniref:VWA-like domain-containing protein n=1 Tax=Thermosipho ferrireducens TaxID=2571116 RepID=A0ABX7S8I6_9BACT|nr:hypothetical protein JYK00_04740 [Thermosipho ferrireducens]